MNMADNHISILFRNHILKHGAKAFPYFDYEKNKFLSDWIKAVLNTNCKYNVVDVKRILDGDKAMKEAQK